MAYPKLIEQLIEKLTKLPGIGRRSAERIVFFLLSQEQEDVKGLSDDILRLKEGLTFCRLCNNLSETEVCLICSDTARDEKTICVVENPKDLLAIERTGIYKGHYFVLCGVISPADGRGPQDLPIPKLIRKIQNQSAQEVVLATDPDTEGEMTALHLTKELKAVGVRVSRIGLGIPMGSSVEFADISTLTMSMNARRALE